MVAKNATTLVADCATISSIVAAHRLGVNHFPIGGNMSDFVRLAEHSLSLVALEARRLDTKQTPPENLR